MPENNNQGSKPAWPWADLPAYREDYRRRNPAIGTADVPSELANRKQWLIWRYEPGETEEKKYRKMPFYVDGGKRFGVQGDEKDRRRLVTMADAVLAIRQGNFDGLGFAFLPDDGLIGIDLDGMIDPESGEVSERCQAIIDACSSYTELSPSGKGVHIFCSLAEPVKSFKSNAIGVEVFCQAQFFTFTGRHWSDSEFNVRDMPLGVLRRLKATVEAARVKDAPTSAEPASRPALPRPPASAGGKQRTAAQTAVLVTEALGHLSPDDYHLWIAMGQAIKADLGAAGYLVWDEWSAKSQKYAGAADTEKRWKSFNPSELTLAALFSRATGAGWISPWAKAEKRKAERTAKRAEEHGPVDNFDYSQAYGSPPPARSADETHFDATSAAAGVAGASRSDPPAAPDDDDDDEWDRWLVRKNGSVTTCLANAELILSNVVPWKGAIGYDEFAERTMYRRALPVDLHGPEGGEWTDQLDAMTAIWLQRSWRVEFSPETVGRAVEVIARRNKFHPVRDALNALPAWDGVRRNSDWLSDYLGVKKTRYTELAGAFFLIGMIKRVMEPGSKFDYCLVLEGEQGRGKSTAARLLAWNWFADTDLDLSNKDALLALPGHWVYEISEMGSMAKAEAHKQKSFLSRQEDEFRPPYGKRLIKVPRQVVFIGTTNEEEYLKDATGGRRFWPVLCEGEFNLDGLRDNLQMMYAEALSDYREGAHCWPSADEQKELFTPEQVKRGMPEPFDDLLYTWVKNQPAPFSMAEAAIDGLKLTADKLTPAVVTRLGISLRRLGCGRKEDRLAADPSRRRLYTPPSFEKFLSVTVDQFQTEDFNEYLSA